MRIVSSSEVHAEIDRARREHDHIRGFNRGDVIVTEINMTEVVMGVGPQDLRVALAVRCWNPSHPAFMKQTECDEGYCAAVKVHLDR